MSSLVTHDVTRGLSGVTLWSGSSAYEDGFDCAPRHALLSMHFGAMFVKDLIRKKGLGSSDGADI
jgi:hypothetical protein